MRNKNKSGKKVLFTIGMLIVAIIAVSCTLKKGNLPKNAETTGDMVSFLATFGWEVEPEPANEKDVLIPSQFSEVYEQYNSLQKKQGFDLSKYKNENVKSYTFKLLNFPQSGESDVYANLLVFEGRIIGGDISSYNLNGFMLGLDGKTQ